MGLPRQLCFTVYKLVSVSPNYVLPVGTEGLWDFPLQRMADPISCQEFLK